MARYRKGLLSLVLGVLLLAGAPIHAQTYPDKALRLVVPFAPGGGGDVAGRLLAAKLTEMWSQPVVVENRAGAGGNIGAELVARASPDGYTLLFTSTALVIAPSMSSKLPFNVERDFTPITLAVELPNVLVVHPSVKANSVAEFVALGKSQPGKMNYASPGSGTGGHLAAELFKQMAGIDLIHVPYKGGGALIADLLAGSVQVTFATLPSVMPYIEAKRIRPLAITTNKREFLMDLPTMSEAGFEGFNITTWVGFLGPAGMAPAVVEKLSTDISRAARMPDIAEKLWQQGILVVGLSPQQFKDKVAKDIQLYRNIIARSGAKIE